MNKRICVIGAGPSGITVVKNLLDAGLEVVCYDRNHEVGGNWIYQEEESHSSVFETTHIISSKTLSQYADFPFDDFDPKVADYPSHDELRRYFQAYATQFDLYPHIQFSTLVDHCEKLPDGTWKVEYSHGGKMGTEYFTHLVVCNGHHWEPRWPSYPGEFAGEFLHSHQYKKAEPFRDKRVLVIGGGNSACDVAVETSRVSSKTTVSMRRGYRIIPKFVLGTPSDVVAHRTAWLPIRVRQFLNDFLIGTLNGKNTLYGLEEPKTKFGETHPTINDELLYKIRHGKVHPKGDIERFEGKTVHFKDGTSEEFDTVVACTGFWLVHPFFKKEFINYAEGPVPLWLRMFHPDHEPLYFVGMFQPLGCIWPGAELQAKIIARELSGQWQRPKNLRELSEREVNHPDFKQINTPRHTITVDAHRFFKRLRKELPKNWVSKGEVKTRI
ncbi:MAG TPA: monooxygenase [Cytophagales bacterium]|nr:monooxygenase [Cytophagales bacterium]HAA22624.1 monooxygenase [Cytophagales bacterium]